MYINKNVCTTISPALVIGLIFSLLMSNSVRAQKLEMIDFKDISFNEALKLSASTGKPLFIDCYTSWCAPCKRMDQTVFTNDTIRRFYNEHFINLKIDMEKGEGVGLAKKYAVGSFPTYLFIDAQGEVVHRSGSLMPVKDFLEVGQRAIGPGTSYAALSKKYKEGERSKELLFDYSVALQSINGTEAERVKKELMEKMTPEVLHSPFGWKVIEEFSMYETDKLGEYLLANKDYFTETIGKQPVQTVLNRLRMSDMYRLIREKDSSRFFENIREMKQDHSKITKRNIAMLEMEYYLETNDLDRFAATAKKAKEGVLKYNDADLSFVARRALYKGKEDQRFAAEALDLARMAVVLNPEEYSNQGTLASVCLELKLKKEGLVAAKKARLLADESTSKIQIIAQDLVNQIEAL